MIIPWQELSQETLTNILETYVLRDGTDYGEIEKTLNEKVENLRRQIESNLLVIVWSEIHQTIDIKPNDYFK
ncbi:YheU family protein [Orbaceae bacterium ac157xtp]